MANKQYELFGCRYVCAEEDEHLCGATLLHIDSTSRPVVLPMMDFQGIYRIASMLHLVLFSLATWCVRSFPSWLCLHFYLRGSCLLQGWRRWVVTACFVPGVGFMVDYMDTEALKFYLHVSLSQTPRSGRAPGRRAALSGRAHSNFIFVVFYFVKYVTWFLEFTYWLFLTYANAPGPSGDRGEMPWRSLACAARFTQKIRWCFLSLVQFRGPRSCRPQPLGSPSQRHKAGTRTSLMSMCRRAF